MNRINRCICLIFLLGSFNSQSQEKPTVNIFIFEVPGLIWFNNGTLNGPSFVGFDLIMKRLAVNPVYTVMPSQRAIQSVLSTPNSCVFPAEQYTLEQEDFDKYLLMAAAPAVLYATTPQKKSRQELIGVYTVAKRSYLHHKKLRKMRINTILVDDLDIAIKMLTANRAGYILLPEVVALSLTETKQLKLFPVNEISEGHIWLICNKENALPSKEEALNALKDIVNTGELQSVYEKFGMGQLSEYQYHPEHGRWSQTIKAKE